MGDSKEFFFRSEKVTFKNYKGRRNGIIKALTHDVDTFRAECDNFHLPENQHLALYAFPSGKWKVDLSSNVPNGFPQSRLYKLPKEEPDKDVWLARVAADCDAWLYYVTFFFAIVYAFNKIRRQCLFDAMNELPTIYATVICSTGGIQQVDPPEKAKKQVRDESTVSSYHSRNKSKLNSEADDVDGSVDPKGDVDFDVDWFGEETDDSASEIRDLFRCSEDEEEADSVGEVDEIAAYDYFRKTMNEVLNMDSEDEEVDEIAAYDSFRKRMHELLNMDSEDEEEADYVDQNQIDEEQNEPKQIARESASHKRKEIESDEESHPWKNLVRRIALREEQKQTVRESASHKRKEIESESDEETHPWKNLVCRIALREFDEYTYLNFSC